MPVVVDLSERWRRARRAAMRATVPDAPAETNDDALLTAALDRAPDDTLRRVFDVSSNLGKSFRAYYRLELPLADLVRMLPALDAPCTARHWSPIPDQAAQRAERDPCDHVQLHPRACELWREAIHGLVLGLGGAILFARHTSAGSGAPRCVDVLYVHPQSPARFGPIPDELRDGLDSIRRTARAFDAALDVDFLGVSEGVLYYRTHRAGAVAPGQVTTSIEAGLHRRFPGLATREVSPRAVFTPDAP